jgi:hypothetical protein
MRALGLSIAIIVTAGALFIGLSVCVLIVRKAWSGVFRRDHRR